MNRFVALLSRAGRWLVDLPALLVLPVVAATLGTVGFEALRDQSDIADSFYRAVQMLGLNFEAKEEWVEAEGGVPLILNIARWLAAVAT